MKLSVLERLEKTAAQFRDKTAYSDAVTSITFGEIEEKAKRQKPTETITINSVSIETYQAQ